METSFNQLLEHIQWHATKYILNDYTSDYKTRLIKLKLLPFMYILDINDYRYHVFYYQFVKFPTSSFNINDYVHFTIGSTRQANSKKLQHIRKSDNHSHNFYLHRLTHIWNALPMQSLIIYCYVL